MIDRLYGDGGPTRFITDKALANIALSNSLWLRMLNRPIAGPYATYVELQRRNRLNAEKAAQIAAMSRAYHLLEKKPQ